MIELRYCNDTFTLFTTLPEGQNCSEQHWPVFEVGRRLRGLFTP